MDIRRIIAQLAGSAGRTGFDQPGTAAAVRRRPQSGNESPSKRLR
jgi:hypothetical protein